MYGSDVKIFEWLRDRSSLLYIYGMRITLKKVLVRASMISILGIIIFYAYFQSRAIIAGPQLSILEPQHGSTATSSLIIIRGIAIHAKEITLQGRPILIDLQGNFAEKLLLVDGYNIIELTATDTQGRQIKKMLALTYHTPQHSITP